MNTTNTSTTSIIDYERLDRLYDGSPSMLAYGLAVFLDEVLLDIDRLEQEIGQQQWPVVADTAHKIVPWVGMVGLTGLESQLRELELQAKQKPVATTLVEQWLSFKVGLDQAIPLLQQELARLS